MGSGPVCHLRNKSVIPAEAGIQSKHWPWVPAPASARTSFAGMTREETDPLPVHAVYVASDYVADAM